MHRFVGVAALLAGLSRFAAPGAERAIDMERQNAAAAWDRGDYIRANLLQDDAGPDAARVLEPIALQTGEPYPRRS